MTPIGSFPGELAAARHTKGHSATGCTLPSDSLTAEEIRKLNGEVKTIRLRPGITWAELCALSDTMQEAYLRAMLEHGARTQTLSKMLGVSDQSVRMRMQALGLPLDKPGVSHTVLDGKDKEWHAWCLKCSEEDKAKEEMPVEPKTELHLDNGGLTITTEVTKGATVMHGSVSMKGTYEEILNTIRQMLPADRKLRVNIEYKHMEGNNE